jgi:hypothetical protein
MLKNSQDDPVFVPDDFPTQPAAATATVDHLSGV